MTDNRNSVTFIADALTSIINYAYDPEQQNAQDMTLEQRMAGLASHAYAARDELEMVKVEINALRATIRDLRDEVTAANRRTGVAETDAQRQAAVNEYERLQTEGSQKFGMMWLHANIPMSRLASARYLPVGAFGEILPHVKTLLCAAAWVLCEHEKHNAEIFERQHKRGFIQYEALSEIARTIRPTMSMALDTDHLTNLLTAKLRSVVERAQKALADDNASLETNEMVEGIREMPEAALAVGGVLVDEVHRLSAELEATKAERDSARAFAQAWKLAAKTKHDNAPLESLPETPETYTQGQYREARGIFHWSEGDEPAEETIARIRDVSEANYFAAIADDAECRERLINLLVAALLVGAAVACAVSLFGLGAFSP